MRTWLYKFQPHSSTATAKLEPSVQPIIDCAGPAFDNGRRKGWKPNGHGIRNSLPIHDIRTLDLISGSKCHKPIPILESEVLRVPKTCPADKLPKPTSRKFKSKATWSGSCWTMICFHAVIGASGFKHGCFIKEPTELRNACPFHQGAICRTNGCPQQGHFTKKHKKHGYIAFREINSATNLNHLVLSTLQELKRRQLDSLAKHSCACIDSCQRCFSLQQVAYSLVADETQLDHVSCKVAWTNWGTRPCDIPFMNDFEQILVDALTGRKSIAQVQSGLDRGDSSPLKAQLSSAIIQNFLTRRKAHQKLEFPGVYMPWFVRPQSRTNFNTSQAFSAEWERTETLRAASAWALHDRSTPRIQCSRQSFTCVDLAVCWSKSWVAVSLKLNAIPLSLGRINLWPGWPWIIRYQVLYCWWRQKFWQIIERETIPWIWQHKQCKPTISPHLAKCAEDVQSSTGCQNSWVGQKPAWLFEWKSHAMLQAHTLKATPHFATKRHISARTSMSHSSSLALSAAGLELIAVDKGSQPWSRLALVLILQTMQLKQQLRVTYVSTEAGNIMIELEGGKCQRRKVHCRDNLGAHKSKGWCKPTQSTTEIVRIHIVTDIRYGSLGEIGGPGSPSMCFQISDQPTSCCTVP